jgi:hypothetical protein
MSHTLAHRLRRRCTTLALTALTALAACADRGGDGEPASGEKVTGVGVLGWQPGMTRAEYMALPDSVRLDDADAASSLATERGVGVEVDIMLHGQQGDSVPLAYSLHDARNNVHFVSRTVPVVPDAPRWRRHAHVWLPVPSPGTYYVRVVLADSTGHRTSGPRTRDFTIQ